MKGCGRARGTYHGLGGVELVVVELGEDALGEGLGSLHEVSDAVGVGLLQVGLNGGHVTLEVRSVGLLVEGGGLQVVAVLQVVDGLGICWEGGILTFFSVGLNVALLSDDDRLMAWDRGTNVSYCARRNSNLFWEPILSLESLRTLVSTA